MTAQPIRLVATDLDGTLLQSDRTINAWTRSVLDAVRARGVLVVPVTARQPVGLRPDPPSRWPVRWPRSCPRCAASPSGTAARASWRFRSFAKT